MFHYYLNNKLAKKITLMVLLLGLIVTLNPVTAQTLLADNNSQSIFNKMNDGAAAAAKKIYGSDAKDTTPTAFAGGLITVLDVLLTFIGIIFLVFLIYAGYIWMMARGDQAEVDRAKKMISELIVGLIIIILARVITQFVLTQAGQLVTPS